MVQVYLGVIQNRSIEIDGYKWPIDTLIVATSNNSEFHRFLSEKEEAPIVDRCRISYISHNTNYRLQEQLTQYAIGSETKTTLTREELRTVSRRHLVEMLLRGGLWPLIRALPFRDIANPAVTPPANWRYTSMSSLLITSSMRTSHVTA